MKPTILLVDDNRGILRFLSDDLGEKYRVITAPDGREAIGAVTTTTVHLIIADIMMPVMNGFELCRYLKASPQHCHIPLILLTARNTLRSKIEGLKTGADACIEKPFSAEHLQVQVANLLMNRNKITEHFEQDFHPSGRAAVSWSPETKAQHAGLMQALSQPGDDTPFFIRLTKVISKHLHNRELDVEQIAELMHISKPTLYRKIKLSSTLGIKELVNASRLKEAAYLLREGNLKIYEVADMVGYSSQTQFGRNFLKTYGITPTEYSLKMRSNLTETNRDRKPIALVAKANGLPDASLSISVIRDP